MKELAAEQHELVGRARALVPLLAERAAEGERARRLPVEVERVLQDAGMFSLVRSRRYGGHQVDFTTYVDVLIELARGDGSAAWLVSQNNNTQWMVGQMGPTMIGEVFSGPRSNVASVLIGESTVRRVAGGFVVDGRWGYCSGCMQSDWVMLGAMVMDEGAPPEMGFFAAPVGDLEIVDDWHVTGFAATSSCSVAARSLLVPERRFAGISPMMLNTVTLAEVETPLQRAALMPFISISAGAIAVGMAEAMLAEFKVQLPGRPLVYTTYASRAEAPSTHIIVGAAAAKIHAARLLFHDAAATVEREAATGSPMAVPLRLATRAQGVLGMRLCYEAVEALLQASGARALQLSNPLQRIDRDLRALMMHPAFAADTTFEFAGRVALGLPPNTPLA